MKAWHFVRKNNRLGYNDNRLVRVGITHTVHCKPILCEQGLHGSVRIIDALKYAPYHTLYRVDITGNIVEGSDKLCGRSRKYLQRFDMEDILFEFARKAAKRNFHLAKPYMSKSDYTLVLKWLKTGDKSLWAAAWAAAWAGVAWAAARNEAWAAAAWAAARDEAWAAAWAAAWAGVAAAAARNEAWAGAWDAERNWQERTLRKMIEDKHGVIK